MYYRDIETRNHHRTPTTTVTLALREEAAEGDQLKKKSQEIHRPLVRVRHVVDIAYLLGFTTNSKSFIAQRNAERIGEASQRAVETLVLGKIKDKDKVGEFYALDAIERRFKELDMEHGIDYSPHRFARCCTLVLPYDHTQI